MKNMITILVLAALLTACSSPSVKFEITSAPNLNIDERNNALPVVVRVYQLSENNLFLNSSFNDLWKRDLNDQVEACRRIFASDRKWTVVRGSDLEEGESQGLPIWREHVGDPALSSNRTRRIDFALFMVEALANDELIKKSPAIVGCQTRSAISVKDRAS